LDTELLATEDVPELGGGINPVCGGNAGAKVAFPAKRSTLSCSIEHTMCINELEELHDLLRMSKTSNKDAQKAKEPCFLSTDLQFQVEDTTTTKSLSLYPISYRKAYKYQTMFSTYLAA
jgi:hypothetical protein